MSDSEELKSVVEGILDENNVEINNFIKTMLTEIAAEFKAAGLIEQGVEDGMQVLGVEKFTLAARLMSACRPGIVYNPKENFPKFIKVLKKHKTMKQLATKMESEFEQAACKGKGGASAQDSAGPGRVLTIGDLDEVNDELRHFSKGNWEVLGRGLGLNVERLEEIDAQYSGKGLGKCLDEALKQWLRQYYDKSDVKPPTWSNLANAVDKAGNAALATTIRGKLR